MNKNEGMLEATATRPSAMPMANTHAMTTATAFARFTSTRLRASGRCCAPGCVPTAASPKRNYPPISASSSSFTTLVSAERHSSAHSLPPSSPDPMTTLKSGKSHNILRNFWVEESFSTTNVTAQVPPERSGNAESADQRLRVLDQSVNDVPALLPGGRDEGADHGEVASPFLRPEAAGDFLPDLHHAPVALGLIA